MSERAARIPLVRRGADISPRIAALLAILICAAPAASVIALAIGGPPIASDDVSLRLLRESVLGTLTLIALGAGAATILGSVAALLVTLCNFPGRGVFAWLLALPLAAPVYVLAYAYSGLTWAGGPIPFPLTGVWGAAFVYAFGFFPYVFLAARAALASQSVSALEAARSLGARPLTAMWRVALPLARPGIVAGAALAAMEVAADYGAAQHFGAATITTGIFRAWFSHGAPQLALQLAALLLIGAVAFLWVERGARGRRGYATPSRWRAPARYDMPWWGAGLASIFCAMLLILGALLPLAWLTRLMLLRPLADFAELGGPLINSLSLAGAGGIATLALGALVAAAARSGGGAGRFALYAAGAGYAAPGAVIALGALTLFGLAREAGFVGGLGTVAALTLLAWTYAARFAASASQPIEAGLARITKNISGAARTLGAKPARRFFEIELPMAGPSVIAAALIVFVEILKELPATLLLRPFDFDTLAVRAYAYASDERLAQSAAPALMVTLAGLVPIYLFAKRLAMLRRDEAPP
ncbi:MAG: ABC transporter permease [Hyphomonadaceae bacterium]